MLNRAEKSVMSVIYDKCAEKGSCLISVKEISVGLKYKGMTDTKIVSVLNSLSLDNYFELLPCERNGEKIYCINLLTKGYAFKRESCQRSREILSRIVFASITALVTFAVGKLLIFLFR